MIIDCNFSFSVNFLFLNTFHAWIYNQLPHPNVPNNSHWTYGLDLLKTSQATSLPDNASKSSFCKSRNPLRIREIKTFPTKTLNLLESQPGTLSQIKVSHFWEGHKIWRVSKTRYGTVSAKPHNTVPCDASQWLSFTSLIGFHFCIGILEVSSSTSVWHTLCELTQVLLFYKHHAGLCWSKSRHSICCTLCK